LSYDAIVVGAGPAGSLAAIELTRAGRDVLLIDRSDFPRDKPCGDGVPPGTIEILNSVGMETAIRGEGFYPIQAIRIGAPSGAVWETAFEPRRSGAQFLVAPRRRFDALIQKYAVDSGARFLRANVRGVVGDGGVVAGVTASVEGREETYRSRVVIGADGATSVVGRALRPGFKLPPRHRAVAMRTYIEGIELLPHRVEFYFYKQFLPGYGWVFPLGNGRANVGIIMRADRFRRGGRRLEALFGEFLSSPALAGRLRGDHRYERPVSWQLGYATHRRTRRCFDGALLIGDAGAFVDPLTGEGIHNALETAVVAARVVHAALTDGDVSVRRLREFDALCRQRLGSTLRRSLLVERLVSTVPGFVDILFAFANANQDFFNRFLNHVSTDFRIGENR
jgi:geranylgeranyl reductase family protein